MFLELSASLGDSAGGNLATAVDGELAKEHLKLTGAILIYPCVQVASTGLPSHNAKVSLSRLYLT